VRIEVTCSDGSIGQGTSFAFKDQASPPGKQLFLVSNKHVVEGARSGRMFFTPENSVGEPLLGKPFHVQNDMFAGQWHGHPNPKVDVAIMPLSWQLDSFDRGGKRAHLRPISLDDVAGPGVFQNLDVSAPVIFVGFPNGMFDEKHFLPIVRRGYVATSPELDFNGEPIFLMDASVFPGSSGSPVFTVGDNLIGGTPALKLLGIVSSVYTQSIDGTITWRPAPVTQIPVPVVDQMIDLGVVFKARCIRETITSFWSTSPNH
jgi:hypothetical protein